jgi:hypothetical protein
MFLKQLQLDKIESTGNISQMGSLEFYSAEVKKREPFWHGDEDRKIMLKYL